MVNYSISFKIKDFSPKINSFSFNNFICLLVCEDFQLRIPFTDNNYQTSKQLLKNIRKDINYKLTIFDDKIRAIIGINDFIIPYKNIYKIKPNATYIYEKEIKFKISENTKIKLFGTLNNIDNMILTLSSKIYKTQKNRLNKNKADKNDIKNNFCLSPAITERASFIQKTNGNIIKAKSIIKKNKKYKNKEEFFSSESNRFISTNDCSGNHFNTYSIIDDINNNNTNAYINNISSIGNVSNQNYFCFNTASGKDDQINNKNNLYNLGFYKNKNIYNTNESNEILEMRTKLKKRICLSNEAINRNKAEEKKYLMKPNENKFLKRNIIIKSKTRNTFSSNPKNKNNLILSSEDEYNSLRNYNYKKLKIMKGDKNFYSCESYSNKQYINTESKKIKIKSITSSFSNNNIKERNKYILLNKDKYGILLNKKKKSISENSLNKVSSSKNKFSNNINSKEKNNKKKKSKKNFSRNILNNISYINKIENLKLNKENNLNNKLLNNKNNNNIKIRVTRKIKNKKNNIIIENNEEGKKELLKYNIKLSQYFILNNKNIKTIKINLNQKRRKLIQTKELFFSLIKKSNRLEEKKSKLFINKLVNYSKNKINKNIKQSLLQIKKKENSILQKIFNISSLNKDEIVRFAKNEKILEQKIFQLQLSLIKNLINHYGNISQIYTENNEDKEKKVKLQNILIKNKIVEKSKQNNIIDLVNLNKINKRVKKIIKNTFNNEVNYQYNIIKEVQEEKESEKENNISKRSNISSLVNDVSDEILFIDKKDSDEDNLNLDYDNRNKDEKNNISINIKNNYSNSNSIQDNNSIKGKDQDKNKKNLRKELIGMNKKKFKGKDLNFDEFDFDFYTNKKIKKENIFKIGFYNKRKKDC